MDSKGFIQLVEKLISLEQKIGGLFRDLSDLEREKADALTELRIYFLRKESEVVEDG